MGIRAVSSGAVGHLIASQQASVRSTARIAQSVDFDGSPVSVPTNGRGWLPPLPPLADRWTRTAVESIIT